MFLFLKVNGGREGRPIGAYELAKAVEELGAGEILLNCIDCDGEDENLLNIKLLLEVFTWEFEQRNDDNYNECHFKSTNTDPF